jgi:hypothetical protein
MMRRVVFSVGSLVVLFFALLALVGIFDALTPGGNPEKTNGSPAPAVTALAESKSQVDGQLCVMVQGQRLRARVEVQVPAQASLVSELWRSDGPSGPELVYDLLGDVRVAQFTEWPSHDWTFDDLAFGPLRLISDSRGTARIQTESDPYFFGTKRTLLSVAAPAVPVVGESRTITVDTDGLEIYPDQKNTRLSQTITYGRDPKSKAIDPACGVSLGTGMTRYVYRLSDVQNRDGSDPRSTSFTLTRDHGAAWWTSDIAGDTIPAVDALLWISAGAFPYALAAWYLWRTRMRRTELRTSVLCVFWLLVAGGALWTMRGLLEHDVFRGVARTFAKVTTGESVTDAPSVVVIDSMIIIGSLAWPLVTWAVNRPTPARAAWSARSRRQRALAMIPPLATAYATAGAAVILDGWSHGRWALPVTFPVAALLGAVAGLALTVFLGVAATALAPWWAAVLGVAAAAVTAVSPFAFTTLDRAGATCQG